MDGYETGNAVRFDFRASEHTKRAVKQLMLAIDPDMTYEELLIAVLRVHGENPRPLEKNHF